jgi:hypothetical protein
MTNLHPIFQAALAPFIHAPCHCKAYGFPHRLGGGACQAEYKGQPICSGCGNACDAITIDVGIGSYEYWGSTGVDVRLVEVSRCCEAELLADKT